MEVEEKGEKERWEKEKKDTSQRSRFPFPFLFFFPDRSDPGSPRLLAESARGVE